MALEVRGHDVLTFGEYSTLARAFPAQERGGAVLAAMFNGEPVEPMAVYSCLEVECRTAAGDQPAIHRIIDRASARLSKAFPDEVPT
jgi:hypothetical protein